MGPCPAEGTEETPWGQITAAPEEGPWGSKEQALIPGLAPFSTTCGYFPEIGFSPLDLPKNTL